MLVKVHAVSPLFTQFLRAKEGEVSRLRNPAVP